MLLTMEFHAENAPDLGHLLRKNPANVFEAEMWFGKIRAFYPVVESDRCQVALLLEVDPVGLVRNSRRARTLDQYVNDRPYVASSFLSVALIEAFSAAMNGVSRERPERVGETMPVKIEIAALACDGGEDLLSRLFAPLGYAVTAQNAVLDERFPEWGDSRIFRVTLEGTQTVQDALTHLYVLIPVLDNSKHYYVSDDEVEKLLKKGDRWLPNHPAKELITRRYLNYKQGLVRDALTQLQPARDEDADTQDEADAKQTALEEATEQPLRLNDARLTAALEAVRAMNPPPKRALDLGCGEGQFLKKLPPERYLTEIVGVDVAAHTLEHAARRLRLDGLPEREKDRLKLMQGSLVYRDARFENFDVALLIEVIEHLDLPRLSAMEQVVFRYAKPRRVIVTTPNAEYNRKWPALPAGNFRHRDHRFEWTRTEFQQWAQGVAEQNGYAVQFAPIGPDDAEVGSPTQMATFDVLSMSDTKRHERGI